MSPPNISLYFHILQGKSLSAQIVSEIQSSIVFSGLYDRCSHLEAVTVGAGTIKGILYPRWRLFHAGDDPELFEYPTLKRMWENAKQDPDGISIYLHSKGASREDKLGTLWRRLMLHGICSSHEKALEALQSGYDAAGCFWRDYPALHASGNFFYVRNSLIMDLPEPAPTEEFSGRLHAEFWAMKNNPKTFELMPHYGAWEDIYRSESYRNP